MRLARPRARMRMRAHALVGMLGVATANPAGETSCLWLDVLFQSICRPHFQTPTTLAAPDSCRNNTNFVAILFLERGIATVGNMVHVCAKYDEHASKGGKRKNSLKAHFTLPRCNLAACHVQRCESREEGGGRMRQMRRPQREARACRTHCTGSEDRFATVHLLFSRRQLSPGFGKCLPSVVRGSSPGGSVSKPS